MLRRLARWAARARTIATKLFARERADPHAHSGLDPAHISDARRIVIIGPAGSEKTRLARRIGDARGWPVHHFDDEGHVAGGGSPLRAAVTLRAFTDGLATEPAWVCEGVDVGWTDPAFAHSDLILWLDEGGLRPAVRIMQRFVRQGVEEARRQRGWRRYFRFGDYARHLRQLVGALGTSARYAGAGDDDHATETRASMATALAPHAGKLLRVRSPRERAGALRLLAGDH